MLRLLKPLGLSQCGPEQLDLLRYRAGTGNQRLKKAFGYPPRDSSRDAFIAFLKVRSISYRSGENRP